MPDVVARYRHSIAAETRWPRSSPDRLERADVTVRPCPIRQSIDAYPLTPVQQGMLFHHLEGTNVGVDIEQFVGDAGRGGRRRRHARGVAAGRRPTPDHAHAVPLDRPRRAGTGGRRPRRRPAGRARPARPDRPPSRQARLAEFLVADRRAGFDLDAAPLWRLTLFRLGPADQRFVFTYHHSLLDTSVVWMTEEALRSYDASAARRGGRAHRAPALPGAHRVAARAPRRGSGRRPRPTTPSCSRASTRRPSWRRSKAPTSAAATTTPMGTGRSGSVSPTTSAIGSTPSSRRGASAARRSSRPRGHSCWPPSRGPPTWCSARPAGAAARACPGSEDIMGLFINTPPVRVTIDPASTVGELLDAVRAQADRRRGPTSTPRCPTSRRSPRPGPPRCSTPSSSSTSCTRAPACRSLGGPFAHRDFDLHDQTNFPLTLLAYLDPQVHFKLSYDRRRFAARGHRAGAGPARRDADGDRRPRRRAGRRAAAGAGRRAGDDAGVERQHRRVRTRRTRACTSCSRRRSTAPRTPRPWSTASQRVTYRELDERANAVAAHLRELGVGPDSMVGIFIERSIDMMVGLLGILKAGARVRADGPGLPVGAHRDDARGLRTPTSCSPTRRLRRLAARACRDVVAPRHVRRPSRRVGSTCPVCGATTSPTSSSPRARPAARRA